MAKMPVGFGTRKTAIAGVLNLRLEMNQVLEQIVSGERSLTLVMQPSDESPLNQLYVVKVLESFSSIGKIRARQALDNLNISHKQKICNLSDQQRVQLLGAFK